MIINQTTTLIFEYPQDYLQEQEWCKTKEDRWIHKSTDTFGAVYENTISYSIGATPGRKTENCSEIPNSCEHITEDGVTCAKYPACDDCLDNPLNKVKGSERLLKGKDEPTISKMEQVEDKTKTQMKTQNLNLTFEKTDEPQTCEECEHWNDTEDGCADRHGCKMTDCAWK